MIAEHDIMKISLTLISVAFIFVYNIKERKKKKNLPSPNNPL